MPPSTLSGYPTALPVTTTLPTPVSSFTDTQKSSISDLFDYDSLAANIRRDLNAGTISLAEANAKFGDLNTLRDSQTTGFSRFLKDPYMMGNITGLASTLLQAAALPALMKNAKLQNKSLQFNLDTAKEEQKRRDSNISAFNKFSG